MKKKEKIITRTLNANSIAKGMRVQVNNREKYQGELGTVHSLDRGCFCSAGWCKVVLDKQGKNGDFIIEEFRYGYQGDVSDLLAVVQEPPQPKTKGENGKEGELVTPRTAQTGTSVYIWKESEFFGQSMSVGKIVGPSTASGWVEVKFKDGYFNSFRYGLNGLSDLVLAQ